MILADNEPGIETLWDELPNKIWLLVVHVTPVPITTELEQLLHCAACPSATLLFPPLIFESLPKLVL